MAERSVDRKDVVLVGKGGCAGQDELWAARVRDVAPLRAEIRGSLARLGVAQLDLFMLHRDDESVPVERIVENMAALHREGLFVTWGVSNWTTARLEAAIAYSDRARLPAPLTSRQVCSISLCCCLVCCAPQAQRRIVCCVEP